MERFREQLEKELERFEDSVSEQNAAAIVNTMHALKPELDKLRFAGGEEQKAADWANTLADLVSEKVWEIWEHKIRAEYEDQEEYPTNEVWLAFINGSNYCLALLERAIRLSGDAETMENVHRYEHLMKIQDYSIESAGWSFDMTGSNVNTTNTLGRSWHRDKHLSSKEITRRKKRMREYEKKIPQLREILAQRETVSRTQNEKRYWEEHPEEYKAHLQQQELAARENQTEIEKGEALLEQGEDLQAALAFWRGKDFARARKTFDFTGLIGAGQSHTVALMASGRVLTAGDGLDGKGMDSRALAGVEKWRNIAAVDASNFTTVGIRAGGTVVTAGYNQERRLSVGLWHDMKQISAGSRHTAALQSSGRVMAVGNNANKQCATQKWKDIVSVSVGAFHTLALRADGKVEACGADTLDDRCKTGSWDQIVMIAAGGGHSVGLRADGTVVACGQNDEGQCNVQAWHDIVSIGAGALHTLGVKSDGTVVACGLNDRGQCNVSGWKNVIAVTGSNHSVGLTIDGRVLCAGDNRHRQNATESWRLFSEKAMARKKKTDEALLPLLSELEEKKEAYRKLGFFSGKKKKELWKQIQELEEKISREG